MTLLCALLALVPAAASAQAYKCKGPDGKTSFQQDPCAPGAKGGPIVLQDPSPAYKPAAKAPAAAPHGSSDKEPQAQKQLRADQAVKDRTSELETRNHQLEERNRAMACNAARHDAYTAQLPRPVYRVDSKGNKQYVEDTNREAEIAAAQKRVAESCK